MVKIKVVIVGNAGIGKTALCAALLGKKFMFDQYRTTIGVNANIKDYEVDGVALNVNYWDTAGGERFATMAPHYYRDTNIALICYEHNNINGLQNLDQWVDQVLSNNITTPRMILVATKADAVLDQDQIIDDQIIEEFKNQFKFDKHYITSAKEMTGIEHLLATILNYGKETALKILANPTPPPPPPPSSSCSC